MTCPHCGRAPDQWHSAVVLVTGAEVCNYAPAWLAETAERERLVIRLMRLDDKQARRRFVANQEAALAEVQGPEIAAEARRRLDAAVLDRWARQRAARTAQPVTEGAA